MKKKNIIKEIIKETDNDKETMTGIEIENNNNEIIIKGDKNSLLELADYIISVSLSNTSNDHVHLDELTIINEKSNIKNLIIEKIEKKI